MTYAEERAAAINRMANQSAANPTNMGQTVFPSYGGSGGGGYGAPASGGEQLDYLASLYGYNTSANNNLRDNLARLQQQGLVNQGSLGVANTQGRYGLQNTQLQTDAQRYGYDVGKDIASLEAQNRLAVQQAQNAGQIGVADTQGRYGVQQQQVANQGQIGVADTTGRYNLDIARLGNEGATARTGLEQSGANYRTGLEQSGATQRTGMEQGGLTTRSMLDNAGADYRTGLTTGADFASKNYGTQVGSDRFGQVWNGAAAPLLDRIFGIKPGSPYETREAPTLDVSGNRPNYQSLAQQGMNLSPSPSPTPAAPPAAPSPPPTNFRGLSANDTFAPPAPRAPAFQHAGQLTGMMMKPGYNPSRFLS